MEENKTRKPITLSRAFLISTIILSGILALIFIISIILTISYVRTANRGVLIALIVIFITLMVVFIASIFVISKRLYTSIYLGLYQTTKKNMNSISSGSRNIVYYPKSNVQELHDLNKEVDVLTHKFNNAIIIAEHPDYNSIALDYVDKEKHIITYESFASQLPNIIFLSQSFRNVIIDASFNSAISKEGSQNLFDICDKIFSQYDQRLYCFSENKNSLLIYLPVISSFRRIEEQLETVFRETSITVREINGTINVPVKFSIVAYPYSDVDELLSDLRYAKRQGKQINFYLPNRLKINSNSDALVSNSMNINYLNRIISSFADLNYDIIHPEHDQQLISKFFDDVCGYFNIDEAAVFIFDEIQSKYVRVAHNSNTQIKSNEVENEYVEVIAENVDRDGSYYFSKPSMANNSLARFIDILHFNSGFFYLIRNENAIIGLVSFYNYDRDFVIDSYSRESLYIFGVRLEHYYKELRRLEEIDLYKSESEHILALSKYSLYRIDDEFRLTYFSKDFKNKYKGIKLGDKCYKAFYDLDKPCRDCPIKVDKKKLIKRGNDEYQVSLTINDRKSKMHNILVEKLENSQYIDDLFDRDLLINSYSSLARNINNSYAINGRGYIILMKIDNIDEIVESQGSEGTLYVLRSFLRQLKIKLQTEEFYYYTPNVLALLMHGVGHVDVINTCEKIYEVSKQDYYAKGYKEGTLNITYLPVSWPRGYASSQDFLRHADDFMYHGKFEYNQDFIYFSDHSISRSASKRAFMLAVIEQEFSTGSFSSVSLQPIVRAKDKRIFGAEILLRINNVYSNAVFNAEEISRIAEQEGKTSLITESIIDFIGNMYKEYGNNVFKINAFSRICINIDSTYLKDTSLTKGITKLNNIYAFPKGFLSFEIPEEIIPQYTEEIKSLLKELASVNIMLSVDRYTGRHVGIEKIKEIGFKEIKLTRDLVGKIDTDSVQYNAVKDIVTHAKENGISVAVVGVENSAQFTLLKELDEDMIMQGYHFYKPLSRADFISALISHNR